MSTIAIDQLEIVAYADAFKAGTLPRVVAPIFRFKNEPQRLAFPPFRLVGDQVMEPSLGSPDDLERMVSRGNATRLENPIEPKPNSVLWIENGRIPQYHPSTEQVRRWRTEAKEKYHAAKIAYGLKQWDQAQKLARHAFALDERSWQALALQAAVDIMRGDPEGAASLQTIATDLVEKADFDAMVSSLVPGQSEVKCRRIKRNAFAGVCYKREYISELAGTAA